MKKNKKDRTKPKPEMEWQIGKYDRDIDFRKIIPSQFLLLCRLVDKPPEDIITDFMDNLACASWKREGRDHVKSLLIEYFLAHGYGQEHYSKEEIRQMFKEMDAVGMLFPNDNSEMIDIYADWRKKHNEYWFNKWFTKNERKPLTGNE